MSATLKPEALASPAELAQVSTLAAVVMSRLAVEDDFTVIPCKPLSEATAGTSKAAPPASVPEAITFPTF